MKRMVLILLTAAFLISSAQKSNAAMTTQQSGLNIAETLQFSGQFNQFSDLLERAELNKVLKGRGPYTVFAPSDCCLQKMPQPMVQQLASVGNECELNRAMRYHIVHESLSEQQIAGANRIKTADGRCISVCQGCDGPKVDNADIVHSIYTTNGIIHVVDNLLLPSRQISLN